MGKLNLSIYDLLLVGGVFVASCSQILLKKSANKTYNSIIKEYLNVYVIVGYAMMAISTLFGYFAYKNINYMNGPIIESTGYIMVMVFSYFLFKEKITLRMMLGTVIIMSGIAIYYMG